MSSTSTSFRCLKPIHSLYQPWTIAFVAALVLAAWAAAAAPLVERSNALPTVIVGSDGTPTIANGPLPETQLASTHHYADNSGLERVQRPQSQSVILEVRIGKVALNGEFVFGYRRDDGTLLVGLGSLADLLAFPIQVDPTAGIAEGWFLSEDRTFGLSVGGETIAISRTLQTYTANQIELHEDDIYVGLETLQAWFPLGITADLLRMTLFIEPKEPLPFQLAQERQSVAGQMANAPGSTRRTSMKVPYQLIAAPAVNITASGAVLGGEAKTSGFGSLSVQSHGDLLGFASRLNALANYRDSEGASLDSLDILLEREDPNGEMLGPLKARHLALGDVLMPSVPLITAVRRGRGAFVSNASNNRVSEADGFVLVGTVPPGWDVELYQDDRLLTIETVGNDGRYEFSTLSLRPGANVFRIVAYGPNGEEIERIERVFLGPGLQSAGNFVYEFGAVQSSDPLVSLSDQALNDELGVVGRVEYGLTDRVSLIAGGAFGAIGKRTNEGALFTGLRASIGGYYLATDVAMEEQGAYTVSAEMRTAWKGLDTFVSHLQRFNPDLNETDIFSDTVIGIAHRPIDLGIVRVGQRAEVSRQNRRGRPTAFGADHQLAMSLKGLTVSHNLNVQWFSSGGLPTTVAGVVALRGRQGDVLYRLQADYSPTQDRVLQGIAFQARRRFGREITATVDIEREFNSGVTSFGADLNWRFKKFSVGFSPSIDTKGNYVVGLTLRTALLPQDQALSYRFAGAEERSGGAILGVRVFADMNANDLYDRDEPLLRDVVVTGTRRNSEGVTDESGVAWVTNLMPGPQTIVTVDQRSLPDVTYRPVQSHLAVQARPGVLPIVDYPVRVFGEVDGFVVKEETADILDATTIAGTRVELVDNLGNVIAQTRSEFDGYYFFSDLSLGTYTVRLASSATASDGSKSVVLTADAPYQADVNLVPNPS